MRRGADASYRSGTVSRSVFIRADAAAIWDRISRIADLESWVSGVRQTRSVSGTKRGVGASRSILFETGETVRERIVGWRQGVYFSYVMIDGLPLRSYHATISIGERSRKGARVTWKSYFGGKKSTRSDFGKAANSISTLYVSSLDRLRRLVEAGA